MGKKEGYQTMIKLQRFVVASLGALLIALIFFQFEAEARNCNYSWQTAKNGSACGARAKSARKSGSYSN